MKKLKKIIILGITALFLTNCTNKETQLNKEITLKGTITNREIIKDSETKKISILNLEQPIIIDGTEIKKIELDYDKSLKNNSEITIKGILKNNKNSSIGTEYVFSVSEIDDILSYVNTFSTEDFSMTLPPEIIKISIVEKIENGFVLSVTSEETGITTEVFKIVCISNEEFKNLNQSQTAYIEKAASNKEKTVIINYSTNIEEDKDTINKIEKINSEIYNIKRNVRLK